MTDITLTSGEVAQLRLRLFRIQTATRKVSVTTYNQARMLVELINKAERRKARQDRKNAAL